MIHNKKKKGGGMMGQLIVLLWLGWGFWLRREAIRNQKARSGIRHIVHVNGTRGKSSVSRLIDAGLRAGGLRVFCKTTGTDPMTIDVSGREEPIRRRGMTNIKEQIAILGRAAAQGAEVLVVECMAVQPELQYAAQHSILKADIGVITNVRRDHTDVMGDTLAEIAGALSSTIPDHGVLFTAEERNLEVLRQRAAALSCPVFPVRPDGSEPDCDFAENLALALAVCEHLGVDRSKAAAGMTRYRRDPYALSVYEKGGRLWINGLSINDVESIGMVYRELEERLSLKGRPLVVLVNNRTDRGSRTEDMAAACGLLHPGSVWLMGAGKGFMRRKLKKSLPDAELRNMKGTELPGPEAFPEGAVIYAIGNLAQGGRELIAWMKEGGKQLVP